MLIILSSKCAPKSTKDGLTTDQTKIFQIFEIICHDEQRYFVDNWARVFVVITFLTFGEAQIIGGIVPNLIAFGLFLGAIGYFASTGKMAEMFGWKRK